MMNLRSSAYFLSLILSVGIVRAECVKQNSQAGTSPKVWNEGTYQIPAGGGSGPISIPVPDPLPGISSGQARPDTQNQAIIDRLSKAIADSGTVNFYGSTVRSAYLTQPAAGLIALAPVQTQIASGAGIIAIIDTGVDPNHPALAGSLVQGYDFTRNQAKIPSEMDDLDAASFVALAGSSSVPQSQKTSLFQLQQSTVAILDSSTVAILDGANLPSAFGHGTMIAGLIHLVAPTALIMPLKAFKSDGTANLSDIIRAIHFAVDNGARVINMSFDAETYSQDLQDAISYAYHHGVLCIAAAGNDGEQELTYPAGFHNVIGVGSTDDLGVRSQFSNYGTSSEFMAAPGEALITTYPGGNYAGVWGTSFSTALVSGTAALMVQVAPAIGYSGASEAFQEGGEVADQQQLGDVRLNVFTAIQALRLPGDAPEE